jgi:hypothetical protein
VGASSPVKYYWSMVCLMSTYMMSSIIHCTRFISRFDSIDFCRRSLGLMMRLHERLRGMDENPQIYKLETAKELSYVLCRHRHLQVDRIQQRPTRCDCTNHPLCYSFCLLTGCIYTFGVDMSLIGVYYGE